MMNALKPSVAEMRTTPEIASASSSPSWMAATAASTSSAARTARRPRSVSSHPPTVRASVRPPRLFSNAAIRRDTVVWFNPRLSAAVVNRPVRDTASRTKRCSGFAAVPAGWGFISAIVHPISAQLVIVAHRRSCPYWVEPSRDVDHGTAATADVNADTRRTKE